MGGRPALRRAPPAEEPPPPPPGPAAPPGGEAMLPWKRHKFELLAAADEEPPPPAPAPPARAGKGGSGSGGRGWAAASALGRLLGGRRQSFRVSREAPTYTVLYLGNAPTLQAKGDGCTEAAVGRIWAKSEAGRRGAPMKLSVGPQGLRLAPPAAAPAAAAARPAGHLYLLHRVTYCAADPRLPRLLAWVYRHEGKHKAVLLRCHAALLARAAQARALALLLRQTADAALADFRRLKRRADARRQHLQRAGPRAHAALPRAPLRRLLLRRPDAAYKPPAERGRAAPRLGPIREDARGEQLEEEEEEEEGGGGAHHHHHHDDDEPPPRAPGLAHLVSGLRQLALANPPDPRRPTRPLAGDSRADAPAAPAAR